MPGAAPSRTASPSSSSAVRRMREGGAGPNLQGGEEEAGEVVGLNLQEVEGEEEAGLNLQEVEGVVQDLQGGVGEVGGGR